jgi:methylated-DNA-[protein]-cysteine S-methyltransferase
MVKISTRREINEKIANSNLTDFQKKVLSATLDIPEGETRTYKQIAQSIGRPKAYRAVGNALNRNPLAPMVPCHRVIKSSGDIGGFAKGRKLKIKMLRAEGFLPQKG